MSDLGLLVVMFFAGLAVGELVRAAAAFTERARWRRRVVFGRDGWPPKP
jgi:hypothetical protein